MRDGGRHDLSHIDFEGKTPTRQMRFGARGACLAAPATAAPVVEDRVDDFVNWVLDCAGLEAAARRGAKARKSLHLSHGRTCGSGGQKNAAAFEAERWQQ
jgi:hypothetical protein